MKISYNHEADALHFRLVDGEHEVRTIRLTDDVALNIGKGEQLVGIEVLEAKKNLGEGRLPKLLIDNVSFAKAT